MDSASSWRAALGHQERRKIVKQIMHTLQKHMPFDGEDGISELLKSAWCIEEKICETATDEQDYRRRISMKMLSLESKSQTNPRPMTPMQQLMLPQQLQHQQYQQLQQQQQQLLQGYLQQQQQQQLYVYVQQRAAASTRASFPASPHQFQQQQQHMDSDWRAALGHEARQRMIKWIMDTVQRHMPLYGQDGMNELLKIARRYEEKIFQRATDQHDYGKDAFLGFEIPNRSIPKQLVNIIVET